MALHSYQDYESYKAAQVRANRRKLHKVWVRPEAVDLICKRIIAATTRPTFGICHGTRRGLEQQYFMDRLMCTVVGTEISPTAEQFPNTIEWDFHDLKEDWIGRADFVYSNSLDHANDPVRALSAWIASLKPEGLLVIEWIEKHGKKLKKATAMDPFAATTAEVCTLIEEAGGDITEVRSFKFEGRKSFLIFARRAG